MNTSFLELTKPVIIVDGFLMGGWTLPGGHELSRSDSGVYIILGWGPTMTSPTHWLYTTTHTTFTGTIITSSKGVQGHTSQQYTANLLNHTDNTETLSDILACLSNTAIILLIMRNN